MAATKSQGTSFTGFLVGITVTAAGAAGFATGIGKVALAIGIIVLIATTVKLIKIKPEEGNVPDIKQVAGLQVGGIFLALAGWVFALVGLYLTANVGARLAIVLAGLAISLTGVLGLLPASAKKNPLWKA
jgi:hypothetical protein